MPAVRVKKEGNVFRLFEAGSDRIATNRQGTVRDGGGHQSRVAASSQARIINASLRSAGEINNNPGDNTMARKAEPGTLFGRPVGEVITPGTFTAKAKRRGLTAAEFQAQVIANKDDYDAETVKQAFLRRTLVSFD